MPSIVWWEIETADPERFMAFHTAFHAWTFDPDVEESAALGAAYWVVRDGDERLGGLQRARDDAPPPSAGVRLYTATDDLEESLALAATLGGMMRRPRTVAGPQAWYATFTDPVGVSWGLWTPHAAR